MEGDSAPPLTGHMTQDPRDPSQWPRDMASMGSVVTGCDAGSLWKQAGVGSPIRLYRVGRTGQGPGIFGPAMGPLAWASGARLGSLSARFLHARL